MKVALVYDRINKFGGAERVLLALHEIWPEAPVFTSVYDPRGAPWASVFKVHPAFLNRLPGARRLHEYLPLLMPLAFESFDLSEYDLVISVTSEAAKGVITKPHTKHLCYCLTPTRYLWSGYETYFPKRWQRLLSSPVINYLRSWDRVASQRPDRYLAISQTVQKRIADYYQRGSEVVYPPIDTAKFKVQSSKFKTEGRYFLVVSRLVKYKRVDIVVEAFNQLGWNLKIGGIGREMSRLRRMARGNIEFLGELTDNRLVEYYQGCRALIFATDEDFGIVPVEAMACGKPVLAFRRGGVTETVVEGQTGAFFNEQTSESLMTGLKKFQPEEYSAADCRQHAGEFSLASFKRTFSQKLLNF